jgi:hypothetical protein
VCVYVCRSSGDLFILSVRVCSLFFLFLCYPYFSIFLFHVVRFISVRLTVVSENVDAGDFKSLIHVDEKLSFLIKDVWVLVFKTMFN